MKLGENHSHHAESRNSKCSQTFAKNNKLVHAKRLSIRAVVQNRFIAAHDPPFVIGYEEYVQEAYHPNGLPEYDKAVDFQRPISFLILTIIGNLFRIHVEALRYALNKC